MITLRNGTTIRLRPVGHADEAKLLKLYEGLDERSRTLRFFTGGVDLPGSVHRLAEVDRDHFGLLACRDSDGEPVGHGEYVAFGDGRAEVALTVAPEMQGLGLGTELLAHLAEAADQQGITSFRAEILPGNQQMIDVVEGSGFPVRKHERQDTVVVDMPISRWPAAMERFEAGHRAGGPSPEGPPHPRVWVSPGVRSAARWLDRDMITTTDTHTAPAGPACDQRVWATPAADLAIQHLRAEMGRLILRHPGGREGEVEARILTMPTQADRTDFCIGIAGGAPFYVDCDEDASLGYPDFIIDVAPIPSTEEVAGPGGTRHLVSRAIDAPG